MPVYGLVFCRFDRLHIDELATAFAFREDNCAVDESKQCVVFAHAYVQSRMVNCAALTFDDIARLSELSTENLDAQSFAF